MKKMREEAKKLLFGSFDIFHFSSGPSKKLMLGRAVMNEDEIKNIPEMRNKR